MNKLLAKLIYNRYALCMGSWFDFIQGNEEETYNYIYDTLAKATMSQKIKLLLNY